MRFASRNRASAAREREDRLREARMGARTLREAFPNTSLVTIQLDFLPATAPLHAAQSFSLYPAARACLLYPCPNGDFDCIYDHTAEADRALGAKKARVAGVLECGGMRASQGQAAQCCGLRLSYTIAATNE
jgi:hypothetical protein